MRQLKNNPLNKGFLAEYNKKTFICIDNIWFFAVPWTNFIGKQVNLELQKGLDDAYDEYASQFQAII